MLKMTKHWGIPLLLRLRPTSLSKALRYKMAAKFAGQMT